MLSRIASSSVHSLDYSNDGKTITTDTTISRFETIFKKLVFGLRLSGIPLDPSGNTSRILRYWSIGFGLASFSFNVFLNIYYLSAIRGKPNSIGRLNIFLNAINFSFTLILIHAGILFIAAFRWKELMKAMKRIEVLNFFQPEDYEKFRKVVVVSTVLLFFTSLASISTGLTPKIFFNSTRPITILSLRAPLFTPFISIGCSLCCMMGGIVVTMLCIIRNKVCKISDEDEKVSLELVIQWHRCYHLIGGLVHEIGQSFGFIILVYVIFNFIWLITCTFEVVVNLRELGYLTANAKNFLGMLTLSTCCTTSMIYVLHRMKTEAYYLGYQLQGLNYQDPAVHQMVFELIMKISNYMPSISLLELVDVDLRLIPTLVGTTLTYIIILLQFETNGDANDLEVD